MPDERPELTPAELQRYSRQISLPAVGVGGQMKLKAARVLVVGAGGLGSPAVLYLAAAGVGTIGLVDFDPVESSNLHRQILYDDADVGRSKIEAAAERLRRVNSHVHVERYETRLTSKNALEVAKDFDLLLDGTDNFATRYLVNDTAVLLGKINVYASVLRFEGQASVFGATGGPCYRCLFREPPPPGAVPSCAEAGVLGVLPGMMGTIQAAEAIKLILGVGEPLVGRLLLVDALRMAFRTIEVRRDPRCPACGTREIRELIDYDVFCGTAGAAPANGESTIAEITPRELAERIARKEDFDLIDVREPYEWEIGRIPGARLIPLGTIPETAKQLDPARDTVLYCKGGLRSMAAARELSRAGFTRVSNLTGGIRGWSDEVDPSVPKY